jgi:23S rRNA pseudouridine1911/1915/1917 synthase
MTDEQLTVPAVLDGERLDRALSLLTGRPRSEVARAIESGGVSLDGSPVRQRSRRLRVGDELVVRTELLGAGGGQTAVADDALEELKVVYEDDDVIVVDKPAGLVTHPGAGVRSGTLVGRLLARYPELADLPANGWGSAERPGIVHRLDKETSGLLVVARSPVAYHSLVEQLASHTARRTYAALALGTKMAVALAGREARTSYEVLARFGRPVPATELELSLETGRTHQIRVHLAAIGHPVLGDSRYGGARRSAGAGRMMLHAVRLGFLAPVTGEARSFEAPPPDDYLAVLSRFS